MRWTLLSETRLRSIATSWLQRKRRVGRLVLPFFVEAVVQDADFMCRSPFEHPNPVIPRPDKPPPSRHQVAIDVQVADLAQTLLHNAIESRLRRLRLEMLVAMLIAGCITTTNASRSFSVREDCQSSAGQRLSFARLSKTGHR